MLKIEKTRVNGMNVAIRGMRNPLESWDKSDSGFHYGDNYDVGSSDRALMRKLVLAGTDHAKFMRFITATCDVIAPLYWWKEADTYRMGVEKNSCSTMHCIHRKPFKIEDFSAENISDRYIPAFEETINALNDARSMYLETGDNAFWRDMIQLLPSSYNQRRTCQFSYQALRNIYFARRNHKLTEWHTFCDWIRGLPLADIITAERSEKK